MRALLSPAARAASTKSESRSFLIRMISLDRMSGYSALFFSAHTAEMFRKANYFGPECGCIQERRFQRRQKEDAQANSLFRHLEKRTPLLAQYMLDRRNGIQGCTILDWHDVCAHLHEHFQSRTG